MKVKIVLTFFCLIVLFQGCFAINTYVGVKLVELRDDPRRGCSNLATNDPIGVLANYGPQGRIRGISSILPEYPIHFKVSRTSDDFVIWEGDSAENIDYREGDTLYLPQSMDLTPGTRYNLFYDIDAIMVYMPFMDYQEFKATANNIYWTAGHKGTGTANEYGFTSSTSDDCRYYGTTDSDQDRLNAYSNNRSLLVDSCWNDAVAYNCDEKGMIGVLDMRPGCCWMGFRTRYYYDNLYSDSVGNVLFTFDFI